MAGMTIHYHGTPISPNSEIRALAGAHFCVSHWRPDQVRLAHEIGQSVMLDNGAFSAWKSGKPIKDWRPYYKWTDRWLDCPTTWAVIPDVIEGAEDEQDRLIAEWPHGARGVPVWHMHAPLDRLLQLVDDHGKVCFGSSGQYRTVMSAAWQARCDEAWDALSVAHARTPWVHMLRGMRTVFGRWPFASVDSTDIGRTHGKNKDALRRLDRWDARQAPATWMFGNA